MEYAAARTRIIIFERGALAEQDDAFFLNKYSYIPDRFGITYWANGQPY